MTRRPYPDPWTPEEVEAWVARHGGNVSDLARRLRVGRRMLQMWKQGQGGRPLPPYIQAHMETLDETARAGAGAPRRP